MTEITRKSILAEAERCVCTDREQEYGPVEDNFSRIAALWNAYKPCGFTAHDVAIVMALLKIGRIASGQAKADKLHRFSWLCGLRRGNRTTRT